MEIMSRAPGDDFTYNLMQRLLLDLPQDLYESYYFWIVHRDTWINFIEDRTFKKDIIVIGIKDHMDYARGISAIGRLAKRVFPKRVIAFHSLENVVSFNESQPNLFFLPWGGDITNQQKQYLTLNPVLDKNVNSNTSFISLNRSPRLHRLAALLYLRATKLNRTGLLTFIDNQNDHDHYVFYIDSLKKFFNNSMFMQDFLDQYFDEFKSLYFDLSLKVDQNDIYNKFAPNDNAANFKFNLKYKYQNVFVELINETFFDNRYSFFTEKTANCFYGCNFPIILNGPGAVQHLRDIGFDMFDDVINHSYDVVTMPSARLIMAIENNRHLLTNVEYTKQLWEKNRARIEKNVDVARGIYKWYESRTIKEWRRILKEIGVMPAI